MKNKNSMAQPTANTLSLLVPRPAGSGAFRRIAAGIFPSLARPTRHAASLALLCGAMSFLAACGAPGEPTPPHAPVPIAISDLTAQQLGDGVVLTFSLPRRTVERESLEAPPVVKIYRSFVPGGLGS